jgi:hypothetical protein
MDDGVLQIIPKLDRSKVIPTFQSGNSFVLDLVSPESESLADDTDFDYYHSALGHLRKANVNQTLYEAGYLILDRPPPFSYNTCALSILKYKDPNLV